MCVAYIYIYISLYLYIYIYIYIYIYGVFYSETFSHLRSGAYCDWQTEVIWRILVYWGVIQLTGLADAVF